MRKRDRIDVGSHYDRIIQSTAFELQLPSVSSLKEYESQERRPAFTRFNVFLRDRFSCLYCGEALPAQELTFDHVIPRSRCCLLYISPTLRPSPESLMHSRP